MESNNFEAILFDIDGTLLDTFDFIYGAFEHAFEVHDIPPLPREQISAWMGGPLEEVYTAMVPGCDAPALAETHRVFQSENVHLATLFPATVEVLEYLWKRRFKLGVITTRSLRTSVRTLEMTGIARYFEVIVSAEDVSNHKPHPEPLLKALDKLGVKPERAVMVGDTYADIMAGKNAGTKTVAALYGFGGRSLIETNPDYAIEDIRDLLNVVAELNRDSS
ncbi:MAG TPA: HAD-IA family hydrolase [Candidatus Kapabacteria bacterium]|jgi:pyrophosphatase PpaX|nr:HAD-IA family hydrolase [Candidatus Kapabacteria bacterium]